MLKSESVGIVSKITYNGHEINCVVSNGEMRMICSYCRNGQVFDAPESKLSRDVFDKVVRYKFHEIGFGDEFCKQKKIV